jgi:hypothetical protein
LYINILLVLPFITKKEYSYLQQGTDNRATGSTDMNEKSSRSHAIFSVTLKQERYVPSSPNSSRAASPVASKLQAKRVANANRAPDDGDWIITTSKFHFVDLAGSERVNNEHEINTLYSHLLIHVHIVETHCC